MPRGDLSCRRARAGRRAVSGPCKDWRQRPPIDPIERVAWAHGDRNASRRHAEDPSSRCVPPTVYESAGGDKQLDMADRRMSAIFACFAGRKGYSDEPVRGACWGPQLSHWADATRVPQTRAVRWDGPPGGTYGVNSFTQKYFVGGVSDPEGCSRTRTCCIATRNRRRRRLPQLLFWAKPGVNPTFRSGRSTLAFAVNL